MFIYQATKFTIPICEETDAATIQSKLLTKVKTSDQKRVGEFIEAVYIVYKDLYFTYLEVNPLVVKSDGIYVLDLAAKIDQTAEFLCSSKWGKIGFPPPFGREAFPEVISIFFSPFFISFIKIFKKFLLNETIFFILRKHLLQS